MKVRLTDIPREGLKVSDTISLDSLNSRMAEGTGNDVRFLTPPRADLEIYLERDKSGNGARLTGIVHSTYEQPCPRCLEPLTYELHEPLCYTLKKRPVNGDVSRGSFEDDIGILYFDGEHIELEDILQESLILAISPFENEHEGCPGVDRGPFENEPVTSSNSLGDLLRSAMEKKTKGR